jgi:DNA-binding response OmpR family regulator
MAGRILVADDSANIRDILKLSLESSGYEVLLAEDGEQALDLFARERPDLMIVDVMMPRVNGFQICRRVKNNRATQATPVILLTAKSQQEDIFWGKDCGADEYVTKPFSTRDLEQVVARLLHEREARAAGTAGSVAEEHRRRVDRGEAAQVVTLEWDGRALGVFRKKYGEIKFKDLQTVLLQEAGAFLAEIQDPGPVEIQELTGIQVVLRGAGRQPQRRAQELVRRLNASAAALYAADDRDRGYIPFRDPKRRQEQKSPLLTLKVRAHSGKAA